MGIDLKKIPITIRRISSSDIYASHIIIKRYLDNKLVGTGMISIKFGSTFSAGNYERTEGSSQLTDLEFDTDLLKCEMVATGLPNINISQYVNVTGEINGICDKFTVQVMGSGGKWDIKDCKIVSPVWWKL